MYVFLLDHHPTPEFISSKFDQEQLRSEGKQRKYLNFGQFSEDLRPEKRHGMVATSVTLQSVYELLRVVFIGPKCVVGRSSVLF